MDYLKIMSILFLFAIFPFVLGNDIVCPDKAHKCPESATCCELPDSTYGCCPMKNAVCCADHIHCCPAGDKCESGMCIQNNYNVTAKQLLKDDPMHVCPGKEYSCPNESTCCESADGAIHGCCLIPDAVCCSDGEHCCPQNTVCDLDKSRCIGKNVEHEMYSTQKYFNRLNYFNTVAGSSKKFNSIICPGGKYQCPDGSTCCKLPNGDWGCCPFPDASCCNDHLHCCPKGMKCDSTSQSCMQGANNMTWFTNEPATPVMEVNSIICPDGEYQCPDKSTCCQLESGNWACCLYENATCCSDYEHCCPDEYKCDIVHKQCIKGFKTSQWQKKVEAKPIIVVKYV